MEEKLYTLNEKTLDTIEDFQKKLALSAVESGKVLHLPFYSFPTPPQVANRILCDTILDKKHKNISFDYTNGRLNGFQKHHEDTELPIILNSFMRDYANFAKKIIEILLPEYSLHLRWGRTSYRPAEIKDRPTSKRKDDTRVHVDSFAATPVHGLRILRVFCNINPHGTARVWDLGEPFAKVLQRFASQIPNYNPLLAKFLQKIKVTKSLRSPYDHYQLQLHDRMKLDNDYQKTVDKFRMDFPSQSTWVVFTDHVSHAAHSGQFLLEQTFYLPVLAMATPELSPLRHWELEKKLKMC